MSSKVNLISKENFMDILGADSKLWLLLVCRKEARFQFYQVHFKSCCKIRNISVAAREVHEW
jgi:hypothetical protein